MDNIVHLCDCMEFMKKIPDKHYDIAIVDPPYGIDRFMGRHPSRLNKYGQLATVNDARPNHEYFKELFRISKNQIIWGYNHLSDLLPPTKEFVFWYKHQPVVSYSAGELAWTSFTKTAKCFDFPFFGSIGADNDSVRIHPTQKPVALYKWLLKNYAKPNDKIFDSHVGSGSIRIACHDMGFDFEGCEIDRDYWEAQEERYNQHAQQQDLFSGYDIQKEIYQEAFL